MSGFNIKKAPTDYEIKSDSLDNYLNSEERSNYLEVPCEGLSDESVATLYILPSAFSKLNEHICWRKRTRANLSEQGGILVGNVFKDNGTQVVCGIVQHVIPSTKSGDATYIQFSHDDWIQMYKEFEDKYSFVEGSESRLKVIGWYHTHPNMPVKMSGIDKNTHVGFFSEVWQFSVILNPQRGTWAVFNGTECKNCNGYIYCSLPENIDSNNISEELAQTQPEISMRSELRPTAMLNSSFVIKRRSDAAPQNAFQHNAYPVRQVIHAGNHMLTLNRTSMQQPYKGQVVPAGDTCYYAPLNIDQVKGEKGYVISDALVRRFISYIDDWSFDGDECIALIYNLFETGQFFTRVSNVNCYRFNVSNGLSTDGFIFTSSAGENFEYFEGHKKDVSLVVAYSAVKPTYSRLHETYGNYDCVLWINPYDINEFEFYLLNLSTKWVNNNFNIRNCGVSITEQIVRTGHELFTNISNSLSSYSFGISGYLQTEYDVLSPKSPLLIKKDFLEQFCCRINRYSGSNSVNSVFSVIISYKTINMPTAYSYQNKDTVNPWLNGFSGVCVIKDDNNNNTGSCSMKGLDKENYGGKLSKFALVISNRDLDVNTLKHKLFGHLTAVCLNIENQSYHFYRLY